MELDLGILDTYFEANGMTVSAAVDIDELPPCLAFIPGKNAHTGQRIYLSFAEISEIFNVNNVADRIEEAHATYDERRLAGERPDLDKEICVIIYDTLAKYIIQMLRGASIAKILFPGIIPLEGHKQDYFRNQ